MAITNALRKLCRDKSLPLRFSLAGRLAMLEKPASAVMWELIDIFVCDEKKFSVLHAVLLSLDRLSSQASDKVGKRLRIISQRTMRSAPADNHIYETLTQINLFRFLRTGDSECEEFIKGLIEECDSQPASHALESQLHTCRAGGWLTAGDGLKPDAHADAARTRTWSFISRLLTAAQEKLHSHRERWRQLHADAEAAKAVQQSIERAASLVDGIAMQLYFASGAFDEKQHKDEKGLSPVRLARFWEEGAPLFDALTAEPHPHTAHQIVQTLHHLLACAPREAFLLAAKSICASAAAGFQYESLVVGDVVKLIQCALADHREIFQSIGDKESDCLESLVEVLDLFVEAGWAEARQLTHRLEEIYR
jgi:hypothetical protein